MTDSFPSLPAGAFALVLPLALTACGPRARTEQAAHSHGAARVATVFTDFALHQQQCQTPKPGEDWRRVCTPRDQREQYVPLLKTDPR